MASRWKTYSTPSDYDQLPRGAGCYVVTVNGKVSYVGQAINVWDRINRGHQINWARYSTHIMTPWGWFGSVVIKVRASDKFGDWAMAELRLIKRLKPQFNKRGVLSRAQ